VGAYESLLNLYRVFCQPTSFVAETKQMRSGRRLVFMLRMAPAMLVSATVTAGVLSLILQIFGMIVRLEPRGVWWGPALISVLAGIGVGAVWNVAMGVAFGIIWGPMQWLIADVALPLLPGLTPPVSEAMTRALPLGLACGVGLGVAVGTARGMLWGGALGLGFAVLMAPAGRVPGVLAVLMSFLVGYFRIEWYVLDLEATLVQLLRARLRPGQARPLLRASPIYWREPIWPPLIGLRSFLRLVGEQDYEAGVAECLFVIAERPTQAGIARTALVEIMARHGAQLDTVREMARAANEFARVRVRGGRMPERLAEAWPRFEELARYAEQHLSATLPHNRRRALERLRDGADELARRLALERGALARLLLGVARKWRDVAQTRLDQMGEAEEAAGFIHNPFVFGQPIEETDSNLFVGRRDVVREIEINLLGGTAKPALALWGPRRMGKTSVLLQLPRLLGTEFAPAFVDMQAMQVRESVGAFFSAITGAAAAALRRRGPDLDGLRLSDLADHPFSTFAKWLENFEAKLGKGTRLLLCLDEFERLETSIREGKLPHELTDQIRHIIQHHPRVVMLISGSHRPDEMQLNWPDVLISTRLIHVSYLEEEEARQLVTHPVPDFPLDYKPGTVERIIEITRCQPYLVQAVCFELVNHLNLLGRREAREEDVNAVLHPTLESTRLYFAEMWRHLSDRQRTLLRAIAEATGGADTQSLARAAGTTAQDVQSDLSPLQLNSIIEPSPDGNVWRFQVPMVAEWVSTHSS
jgi:hypothetical protein